MGTKDADVCVFAWGVRSIRSLEAGDVALRVGYLVHFNESIIL